MAFSLRFRNELSIMLKVTRTITGTTYKNDACSAEPKI